MSASWFSGELKTSRRFQLGELLSDRARHFLLMTATPHNGKEEDFQAFLASDAFKKAVAWGKAEILRGRPKHKVYTNQ